MHRRFGSLRSVPWVLISLMVGAGAAPVRASVSDIGVGFGCIADSIQFNCTDRIFPGRPWRVIFGVTNEGNKPVDNWSFDLELINQFTGERIPLKTQVPGDPLPVTASQTVDWPSPHVFDSSEKGLWQVDVTVRVKDPSSPEQRLGNNRLPLKFRVDHPVADIGLGFKCVTDSTTFRCLDRVSPGELWQVVFEAFNKGEVPIEDWSYDVVLVNQDTNERTTLGTQIPGEPVPIGSYRAINWASPILFNEAQKGTRWQVEVTASIKDPTNPEPGNRQSNNRTTSSFRVNNPIADIGTGFMCVMDSLKQGCINRVFPGQPWHVSFYIYNKGETAISDWSYDIDLVNPGTAERIPLETQVPGEPLVVGGLLFINRASPYRFDVSEKGTSWQVEVTARVKDPSNPEPADRQSNNRSIWPLQVENPVSDIGVSFTCVTDSLKNCVNRVFPGRPWHVLINVYNKGDLPLTNWSYDIDLVNEVSGGRTPLEVQAAGDSIGAGQFAGINWESPLTFDESQKGSRWHVEVRVEVKDPNNPEPPGRQGNNQATWPFQVANPISDIGAGFSCVQDSLKRGCTSRIFPGQEWHFVFSAFNKGEKPIENWSYDIELVNRTSGARIPVVTQVPGDPFPPGTSFVDVNWESPYRFDETQLGPWQADVTFSVKDPTNPEPAERQFNNRASWQFQVENPIADIGVGFKCVTDSTKSRCLDRVFPGQPWHVRCDVFNKGDVPLLDWSYDVELVNLASGTRIPLKTQVTGDSLPVAGYVPINCESPRVFDESEKGSAWRVEVRVDVKDPNHPEPTNRQGNNLASWQFQVDNPVSDIGIGFTCVQDSLKRGCISRIFPGQRWHLRFDVYNKGEVPLLDWSYDVDLVDFAGGTRIPIATQVAGAPLALYQSVTVNWESPHRFDASEKGNWRVEVKASVKQPNNPEPPERRSNNTGAWQIDVENPAADIGASFVCATDSLKSRCLDRVFPGQRWHVRFDVYNKGDLPLDDWSYDIELVNLENGQRTPLKTQVAGDPLPLGGFRSYNWESPLEFDESQKGSRWRVELTVRVKDPSHPEPASRQGNNHTTWQFQVDNPFPDIGVFACVQDSLKSGCTSRILAGYLWHVRFDVFNKGEKPLVDWSYDIDLVNASSGERTPLEIQVAGAPIPLGGFQSINWASPRRFDDGEKGSWQVEVRVEIKDPSNPEPNDRRFNNQATWTFQVENPTSDLGIGFKCVVDSTSFPCRSRLFPGQTWHVTFSAYNKGDVDLNDWSYDIVLIDLGTGTRTPLKTQVAGEPLPVGAFRGFDWASPLVFDESQKGRQFQVEVTGMVKDPNHPEPTSRQNNNRSVWQFQVDNPFSDIGVYACITDSLKRGCISRVLPGQLWHVAATVVNKGERPIENWSYDIDLFNTRTGETIPLLTQVAGDSLPVSGSSVINWESTYRFDSSQKDSAWQVVARVAIKDPDHPESPDRQYNNESRWSFRIENAVADIGIGFKCVTDSLKFNCLSRVFPGYPWHVFFSVFNKGDFPLSNWSYDIDLVNLETNEIIPIKTQVAGEPLAVDSSLTVNWESTYRFEESQKGGFWRVELRVAIKDLEHPEPVERQFNNQASWSFQIDNPIADIGMNFVCVANPVTPDSFKTCTNVVTTGQPWHVLFQVFNKGDLPLENWSFDIDLVNLASGERRPLKTQVAGDTIPVNQAVIINWPSELEFDPTQKGAWQVDVTVEVKDANHPEPPDRQGNNRISVTFQVENPPESDIGISALCVADTLKACTNTVALLRPWHIKFDVVNKGEKPIENWNFNIDIVNQAGERIPIKTHASTQGLRWEVRPRFLDPRTSTGIEGAAANVIAGKIYVSHGFRGFDTKYLSIFDLASNTWTHGGPSAPDAGSERSEMGGGTALGRHYAVGGRTGPSGQVEEFDPGTGLWATKTPMSIPRGALGVASWSDKLYAIGGRSGPSFGSGTIYGLNEEFDPSAGALGAWTTLAPLPLPVCDNYATVAHLGKIYVCGGTNGSGVVNTLQIYDITTDSWTMGAPMPTQRAAAMAGVIDGLIVVFGGYNGTNNLAVTELYDPATDTWFPGPDMPAPTSEIGQGVTYDASGVYSIGSGIFGASGSGVYVFTHGTPVIPIGGAVTTNWEPEYRFISGQEGPWHVEVEVEVKDPSNPDTMRVNNRASALFEVTTKPTGTLLALFEGKPRSDGLELRWQFGDPELFATVHLERSAAASGPWSVVASEPRDEGGVTVVLDRGVTDGRTYYYRLSATTREGRTLTFGPLALTSGVAITAFTIGLAPNPSTGTTRVDFTVPQTSRVKLSVLDIQGREVAMLAEGIHTPGRYQATWNGRGKSGTLPAGMYLMRYQTPSRTLVKRLVLIR